MITRIPSLAFNGINIIDVDVQVQLATGVPNFTIVGLADKTIGESRERVRAALSSIGIAMPAKKILINLRPADLIKEGSHFDLAIAVAILSSINVLPAQELANYLILGELSLDGSIIPVNGVLPAAIGALSRDKGLICAKENGSEAIWSGNDRILAPHGLLELINHFKGTLAIAAPEIVKDETPITYPDMADIKGQKLAKRAIEVAAAGGHNLLMVGSPGTGKSMLAARLPGIMPELVPEEILESSTIASIAGNIKNGCLIRQRPFRSPHHSCSAAAMVGGGIGRKVKPGEISLAHNGVLFLDELPEFNNAVIESLRQPIETGEVLIARSGAHVKYPANFQLVAAMNPCKCGYLFDDQKSCHKVPHCGTNYQAKISGPILDRFDIHIDVNNEENYHYDPITDEDKEEKTADIAARVKVARKIQLERYEGYDIKLNSNLDGQLLIDYALPVDEGRDILNKAAEKFRMSMRGYNRVLRVARTIADLERSKHVNKIHIAEALSYRKMDLHTTLHQYHTNLPV